MMKLHNSSKANLNEKHVSPGETKRNQKTIEKSDFEQAQPVSEAKKHRRNKPSIQRSMDFEKQY
jgi:hypothetical protein